MLEQLLRLVAEGGVSTCTDLAERMSVDRSLVEAILEELARLGYLRVVASECAGHCTGCSMAGCSAIGSGRLWALTDRGARAAPQATSHRAGTA